MSHHPIDHIGLVPQQARLRPMIDAAWRRVLEHGRYVNGPEVVELETALGRLGDRPHAIACASGTDALVMALMALGVSPGQDVLVPAFTFAASASAVALVGANPVFVDVRPDTANIDPHSVARVVNRLEAEGRQVVGLIAVGLYGQPPQISRLRSALGGQRWIIDDAAQSFGAGAPSADRAEVVCTSFFPTKPLGAYGDAGAVLCDDAALAADLRSIRSHGSGADAYDHVRIGLNARIDSLQAGILLAKISVFDDEVKARRAVADRYMSLLDGVVDLPTILDGYKSTWAQFTVRVPRRTEVIAELGRLGVPTAVHYPRALPDQPAFGPWSAADAPVARQLARDVLSLPIHAYLDVASQDRVVSALRSLLP